MLKRLLSTVLARYKWLLWTVIAFQFVQAMAGLFLPTLNSDIINNGVVKNDVGYIWRMGGVMLAITLVQVVFSVAAVYVGSRVAMGFGRDVRKQLFHQVKRSFDALLT